jgi:hypothetical protein
MAQKPNKQDFCFRVRLHRRREETSQKGTVVFNCSFGEHEALFSLLNQEGMFCPDCPSVQQLIS